MSTAAPPRHFASPWLHHRSPRPAKAKDLIPPLPSFPMATPSRRRGSTRLQARALSTEIHFCWVSDHDDGENDGFGGWWLPETHTHSSKGWEKSFLVGAGTSVAIVLAGLTYYSLSRQGRGCHLPSFTHNINFTWPNYTKRSSHDERITENLQENENLTNVDSKHALSSEKKPCPTSSVPADCTQLEALGVLKKLQIIENDVPADALCSRREFARWLVKANSNLERRRIQRIVPSNSAVGTVLGAFDDVNFNDPDFHYIQSLGEAGIVHSRLCSGWPADHLNGEYKSYFQPDSYLSRFDLINWRTLLEYPRSFETEEKTTSNSSGFLDINSWPSIPSNLIADAAADERSIIRKVFGNTRRLQPCKPVTNAQAAVSLLSGRMEELIRNELSRLELEAVFRGAAMEEIRAELVRRGDAERCWDEKFKCQKECEMKRQENLQTALNELKRERKVQEEFFIQLAKEKAALDCRSKLLSHIRTEVSEMSSRLALESGELAADQLKLNKLHSDVKNDYESAVEAKSKLKAEKEALRVLRSWVEEEAQRMQLQTEVLLQAARRWRWEDADNEPDAS